MVAKLKLKGIDGRAPSGPRVVALAALLVTGTLQRVVIEFRNLYCMFSVVSKYFLYN